jgi:hypothetical protein
MVRFDKTVLVIHSGVPLKKRSPSLTPCPPGMASEVRQRKRGIS